MSKLKGIESNPVLDKLPDHLRQFVKPQNYESYTAVDQAVWRYVMRRNVSFLKGIAHDSYLNGLDQTGISIETIPSMYGMNRILKKIGWAAVAVDGFIPPAEFMEFLAYNVLIIAADIRQVKHIEYTPTPDIIHEGAGHSPIIANPEYAEYLRRIGELGAKAISSAKDYELYEAVRHLSIIKEAYGTPQKDILEAEERITYLQDHMGEPSEMALIRNLLWWTVEYGLIGTVDHPKIYGAGLLSSIGEGEWCLSDKVRKIPYTLEAIHQGFDITKPQPQLFVTPSFAHLNLVLEEYAHTMAVRRGGLSGLRRLIESKRLGTIELSTEIQVSGRFTRVIESDGKPVYFQTSGASALANRNTELIGHSRLDHPNGFASPIGMLEGINIAIENMSPLDLAAYKINEGEQVALRFEGGITVEGEVITGKRNLHGKILLVSFKNCTVKHHDEVLFHPDQGIYDMVIGKEIISAFNGPADNNSFNRVTHVSTESAVKIRKSKKEVHLETLYEWVRNHRERKSEADLKAIFQSLCDNYPDDWLLMLEIYELTSETAFGELVREALVKKQHSLPEVAHLISNGTELMHREPAEID